MLGSDCATSVSWQLRKEGKRCLKGVCLGVWDLYSSIGNDAVMANLLGTKIKHTFVHACLYFPTAQSGSFFLVFQKFNATVRDVSFLRQDSLHTDLVSLPYISVSGAGELRLRTDSLASLVPKVSPVISFRLHSSAVMLSQSPRLWYSPAVKPATLSLSPTGVWWISPHSITTSIEHFTMLGDESSYKWKILLLIRM